MAEVVRMTPVRERAHLAILLRKIEISQKTKARTIADNGSPVRKRLADTCYRDAVEAYNFYKREYSNE